MRLLVCGGRDYADRENVFRALDELHREPGIAVVIHGAAKGADELAAEWAKARGIEQETYPADWKKHGRAAGPIRNGEMLRDSRPDALLAFSGGPGTADMVKKANAAGVPVLYP